MKFSTDCSKREIQRRHLPLAAVAAIVLTALMGACAAPPATPLAIRPVTPAVGNFLLTSSAFAEGANIPPKFTCSGEGKSPQLTWSGAPANSKSFTLIVDDPDAPGGTFTHWVAFDIPATQTEIPEGAQSVGRSGRNGRGQTGYTGPCPPSGTHRYFFTLYALDVDSLGLSDGASRVDVEKAMAGHVAGQSQLMGRYTR